MWERTLTLSSAGKSYSFTGWKVGWATGPADLVGAVLAAKQWLTFTSGAPLQPAVAHALDERAGLPGRARRATCRYRRDLLCAGPRRGRGLAPSCPRAPTSRPPTSPHLGWDDGLEFCEALPERAGVVAIPSQVFHDDQRTPGGTWCAGRSARRPS